MHFGLTGYTGSRGFHCPGLGRGPRLGPRKCSEVGPKNRRSNSSVCPLALLAAQGGGMRPDLGIHNSVFEFAGCILGCSRGFG